MGAQNHADRNGDVSLASPHDDAAATTRAAVARVPMRRSIPEKMIACAGSSEYQ